jgi:hypothetical protein
MKIQIKKDASSVYTRRQMVTHGGHINYEWAKTLEKIEGKEIEVETHYLFRDQYNTPPIPGVSENGLRIMQESVEAVIDDIRPSKGRCSWCGAVTPERPCIKCGQDMIEWFSGLPGGYDWDVHKLLLSEEAKKYGLKVPYPYHIDAIIEGGERVYW